MNTFEEHPLEERLSALMDGELSSTEQRIALDQLQQDEAARQRWLRWHLIGDAMRDASVTLDVSQTVRARLETVPPLPREPSRSDLPVAAGRRWSHRRGRRLALGGALAASLAAAVWTMGPLHQAPVGEAPLQLAVEPATLSSPPSRRSEEISGPYRFRLIDRDWVVDQEVAHILAIKPQDAYYPHTLPLKAEILDGLSPVGHRITVISETPKRPSVRWIAEGVRLVNPSQALNPNGAR